MILCGRQSDGTKEKHWSPKYVKEAVSTKMIGLQHLFSLPVISTAPTKAHSPGIPPSQATSTVGEVVTVVGSQRVALHIRRVPGPFGIQSDRGPWDVLADKPDVGGGQLHETMFGRVLERVDS